MYGVFGSLNALFVIRDEFAFAFGMEAGVCVLPVLLLHNLRFSANITVRLEKSPENRINHRKNEKNRHDWKTNKSVE